MQQWQGGAGATERQAYPCWLSTASVSSESTFSDSHPPAFAAVTRLPPAAIVRVVGAQCTAVRSHKNGLAGTTSAVQPQAPLLFFLTHTLRQDVLECAPRVGLDRWQVQSKMAPACKRHQATSQPRHPRHHVHLS